MAKNLQDIEVRLENPISIAVKGAQTDIDTILLREPTSKVRKHASKIKQLCQRAMMDSGKEIDDDAKEKAREKSKDDDKKMTGKDLVMWLNGTGVELDDVYNAFEKVITVGGCASANGEKLTGSIVEEISFSDFENMFGEWANSFLLSSLTQSEDGKS